MNTISLQSVILDKMNVSQSRAPDNSSGLGSRLLNSSLIYYDITSINTSKQFIYYQPARGDLNFIVPTAFIRIKTDRAPY